MGWLARVIVTSATAAVVGCASIAGIGEGSDATDPSTNGAIVDARPDAAPPSSSGSSGFTADASLDAAVAPSPDAADAGPPCTKAANGLPCGSNADCCSDQCSSLGRCTSHCAKTFEGCGNDVCCLSLHCTGGIVPFCAAGP
jgi:hypothetical protein